MDSYQALRSDESSVPDPDAAGSSSLALNSIFEISPDAIFVITSEGLIREANPRALKLFGYGPEELLGRNVELLIPERFREHHRDHRREFHASPRTRPMEIGLELFGLRNDGTEFPVDIMLKPMQSSEGSVTLCFVRDNAEQKAEIEAVRKQDLNVSAILESVSDDAIYRLDLDGNVTTWNPGAERIKGYTAEEIIGKHFSTFFTHEDRERGRPAELMHAAVENGRVEEEGWRVRKDGSQFWADVTLTVIRNSNGEAAGFAKITRDFSNRKGAEEALMREFSTALLVNLDVHKLGDALSESIRDLIPHHATTVAVYDAENDGLLVHFLRWDESDTSRGRVSVPLVGSPDGQVFRTRQPLVLNRIEGAGFVQEAVRHLTDSGMQSGCWVPLIHRSELVGVLGVASRVSSAIGPHEAKMLEKLASQASVVVVNARAFQELTELRDRLVEERHYLESEITLDNHFEEIVGECGKLYQTRLHRRRP